MKAGCFMRLLSVTTASVGGIADGTVELADSSITAFAGGNGTGKSKLLACLLAPWSGVIPDGDGEQVASVQVVMSLTGDERKAFEAFSVAVQWGAVTIPDRVTFVFNNNPRAGMVRHSVPNSTVLNNALSNPTFVQTQPSLDVVYLPAERRLLPANSSAIDLTQLSDLIAVQKTAEPRAAVTNYGRLDDQEFEGFARALCVAASLPSETEDDDQGPKARAQWEDFLQTVNSIIAPKVLLPLTRQNPEQLRIKTPTGATHLVQDLSSGERQALIIMSRVMRAGAGHPLVLIDEPDAYLHPHLSQRLIQALETGIGPHGQLVVATHSPAILDALAPKSIIRMGHDHAPKPVSDEGDRLDLYRSAGFRASALTQADLLLVVEGVTDIPLLQLQFPELARASIRSAGGRAQVLSQVEQLAPYDLPVLGAVDGDIEAPAPRDSIAHLVTVWPTADIEGVYLSDDRVLEFLIDRRLVQPDKADVALLRGLLNDLLEEQRESFIAESVQRLLRARLAWDWPSPRGQDALLRLRQSVEKLRTVDGEELDALISQAEATWASQPPDSRWQIVRAKPIAGQFASRASVVRSGQALLETIAREKIPLPGFAEFDSRVHSVLEV